MMANPGVLAMFPAQVARSAISGVGLSTANEGQSAGPSHMGDEPGLVHLPGGESVNKLVHPAMTIFERLYRVLPEGSFYSPNLSPTRPVQFEFNSFTVPDANHLWLFDYEFSVYRLSGVDPGDIVKSEDGRFSGFMGFDVVLNNRRLADIAYELDPQAILFQRSVFDPPIGQPQPPGQFNRAQATSFASTASAGTSLLPVRSQRMGARDVPFTFVIPQNTKVSLACVIFRTVTTPIAAIEGKMGGFLMEAQTSSALVNRLRPR